ncbi:hypothetical protein ACFV9E_20860 [Streptomyces sp. NPDC059835]|uniref:hypothetical protein n=1 Tax=Streptomyces sp. NPDC059835 TaxID=3346967 RepID=UPI003651503A
MIAAPVLADLLGSPWPARMSRLLRFDQQAFEHRGPGQPPCALIAVEHSPHLRTHIAAWVERPLPWGVAGIPYDGHTLLPVPGDDLTKVAYGELARHWIVATRQVLSLNGCTAVFKDTGYLLPSGVVDPQRPLLREAVTR